MNNFRSIETDRLALKVLGADDWREVLDFLNDGKEVFEKYEAARAPLFYTREFQMHILKNEYEAALRNAYLRYYIYEKENPYKIIGTVSYGNVLPDPYMSATLGYKISPDYQKKGYATEAINASMEMAYKHLNLHRIIAYVQVENKASIRVLEKCGLQCEGLCKEVLHINGEWKDHFLYGKCFDRKL